MVSRSLLSLVLIVTALHAAAPPLPSGYRIEPPDILTIDLTGVPKAEAVQGEHLVRPDGTVSLGVYGTVSVSGLTAQEARTAITRHLRPFAGKANTLRVEVTVFGYNSQICYVITAGQVHRLPLAGKETVLDAISQFPEFAETVRKGGIVLTRPRDGQRDQRLEVDWKAITQWGDTTTNYQLLSGDRLHLGALARP